MAKPSTLGDSNFAAMQSRDAQASGSMVRSTRSKIAKIIARKFAALALLVCIGLTASSPSFADRYDKHRAGHPLRIAAYVIYPIGALLDVLIMRPAHWLISQEPFKSAVGHEH